MLNTLHYRLECGGVEMSEASVGLTFITCLLVGSGIGLLLGNLEAGGAVGLLSGILSIVLFRKGKK
jgi:hypothetical protein